MKQRESNNLGFIFLPELLACRNVQSILKLIDQDVECFVRKRKRVCFGKDIL